MSYDEGLHLIRAFLEYASHHTVEELQAFTAQWVPHPQWIKVEDATVSEDHLKRAGELIQEQLGPDGIRQVGGRNWWQWRRNGTDLKAEWIEMRSQYNQRNQNGDKGRRIMMYIHGGGYFFGSVDEHRYQMQRHARKLKARVFAPKYRLAPQFPFPCGLQDCVAAYLYLLTIHDPSEIIFAGDSAGGGMVMSTLCVLRDQGIPLPAGAVLISPWVDLTHSFPSVVQDAPLDYIPQAGFHHKPSKSWPPPNEDDVVMLKQEAEKKKKEKGSKKPLRTSKLEEKQQAPVAAESETSTGGDVSDAPAVSGGIISDPHEFLHVEIDGKMVAIKDQIQMYAPNTLLRHPLVSSIMQPTLGGLPPLLIMVGGGEVLRDEQIYLAHKCANPAKYAPPPEDLDERGRALLEKYKPTDVQLQVWEDLCHVAPTLSFTRPAKYMYRSIAQFGAWALARAQNRGIDIMDDDDISVISSSSSTSDESERVNGDVNTGTEPNIEIGDVGKAGDPLPAFKNHMIRQRVTRHGKSYVLANESDLPGCCQKPEDIGAIRERQLRKWLAQKKDWDNRFATAKARVHKKIISDMVVGYHDLGPGEKPPPTALAGRRRVDEVYREKRRVRSLGLGMWSLWGSKHDEATVDREQNAAQEPEAGAATSAEGKGARSFSEIESQAPVSPGVENDRRPSHSKTVVDHHQTEGQSPERNTPVAELIELRKEREARAEANPGDHLAPETGAAGKRPFIDGIALPFSLGKEPDTASMLTLHSGMSPGPGSRPMSPARMSTDAISQAGMALADENQDARPGIESFVTAQEIPQVSVQPGANGQDAGDPKVLA